MRRNTPKGYSDLRGLREAHAIADRVMERIEAAFPDADVLIHEDPYGIAERRALFK